MHHRMIALGGVAVAAAYASACNVSDPVDVVNGTYQQPVHSGEQAEVAMTVAQDRFGRQTVAAGYRFTGPYPLPANTLPGSPTTWDIVYAQDGSNNVAIKRGASAMGHAYSPDGFTWIPGPKISPIDPAILKLGDPVAVLWSDPGMMAGFLDKKLVAYSSLAVSNEAFDSHKAFDPTTQQDVLPFFLSAAATPLAKGVVDSACVALSDDGGQNYRKLVCVQPSVTSAPGSMSEGTDQPSVGVDKNDAVFLVVDDFGANDATGLGLRLYVVTPSSLGAVLTPLAVDPRMGDSHHTPRIARDQDGDLWLAAASGGGAVRMCHIRPGAFPYTSGSCDFVGEIVSQAAPFPPIQDPTSSVFFLRTGLTVSFAVNRVKDAGAFALQYHDFYFAYQLTGPTGSLHIAAGECTLPSIASLPLQCKENVPGWGTSSEGEHFEPSISFVDHSPTQDGSQPDVQYSFYEADTANTPPGNDPPHIRVRRAVLHGSAFGSNSVTFENLGAGTPPAPVAAPAVCPARYGSSTGLVELYWGDFFAFGFVPNLGGNVPGGHLVIYSSDENLGCLPQTNVHQGRELHLQSWFWGN